MLEPSLIIRYKTDGVICTPVAPQYAGVQGDNGRCRVDFVLHEDTAGEDYVYRVELVNGSGGLVVGGLTEPQDGTVTQLFTTPFTEAGGRCTVRLIACETDEDGNELSSATVMSGTVYFDSRPADTLPHVKHSLSEMLIGVAKDAETAEECAAAAKAAQESATEAANESKALRTIVQQQAKQAAAAFDNARQSADEARDYAEQAAASLQTASPLYVSYGTTSFSEVWEAAEKERPMVFLDGYYGTNGRLVYFDEGDKAIFEYVTPEKELYYAALEADTDEWSKYPCPYLPASQALGFHSYLLPAGQNIFIPTDCVLFASGASCGIVKEGAPLLSSVKSISLICTAVNGTKQIVTQYTYIDGQGGGAVFPAGSTTFLRNTSTTDPLTIFYLSKEG